MSINLKSLCNIQRKNLDVTFDFDQKTHLIAVFTDKQNSHLNNLVHIPCKEGLPISGYSYDCVSDCYIKECINYYFLGIIEGVAYLQVHNSCEFRIPLTFDVCMKLMSKSQKKLLKDFIKVNQYENLELEFLQIVED